SPRARRDSSSARSRLTSENSEATKSPVPIVSRIPSEKSNQSGNADSPSGADQAVGAGTMSGRIVHCVPIVLERRRGALPAPREVLALLVAGGRLHADDRALVERRDAPRARVGHRAAQARGDHVEEVLDARP